MMKELWLVERRIDIVRSMGITMKDIFAFGSVEDLLLFEDERTSKPVGIYLLRINNRNTRTMCEICSKLTMKRPELRQWRCSGVFNC